MTRDNVGNIGLIFLAILLMAWGLSQLVGLAIPTWLAGLAAIITGILLLAGR